MSKLGILSKVYLNTASFGTPTWVEVEHISDLSIDPSWDEGDASSRASRAKRTAKTMLDVGISGSIKVSDSDSDYQAFRDAAYQDDTIDLMILNGDQTDDGVHGYRAEFNVFSSSEDQAKGNRLYMNFTLKPGDTDNAVQYAVVASSTVGFTAI